SAGIAAVRQNIFQLVSITLEAQRLKALVAKSAQNKATGDVITQLATLAEQLQHLFGFFFSVRFRRLAALSTDDEPGKRACVGFFLVTRFEHQGHERFGCLEGVEDGRFFFCFYQVIAVETRLVKKGFRQTTTACLTTVLALF